MELFAPKNIATGREYWKLKQIERQKHFVFFFMAEMLLIAAAVLVGLLANTKAGARLVFNVYFILLLAFCLLALLIAMAFLLSFYWYGYRPAKDSRVLISAEEMTFEAELIGFSGRRKHLQEKIRYCDDNGVYTKLGRNRHYFVWIRNRDLSEQEKRTIAAVIEKLKEKRP